MVLTNSSSNSIVYFIWILGWTFRDMSVSLYVMVCLSAAKEKGSIVFTHMLIPITSMWRVKFGICEHLSVQSFMYYLFLSEKRDEERAESKTNEQPNKNTKRKVRRKWCWWWCWKSETIETNLLLFNWATLARPDWMRERKKAREKWRENAHETKIENLIVTYVNH